VNDELSHVIHRLADGRWVHAFQTDDGQWVGGTDESLRAARTVEELAQRGWANVYNTREEAKEAVERYTA
jgi:hypothetical protein